MKFLYAARLKKQKKVVARYEVMALAEMDNPAAVLGPLPGPGGA